MELLSSLAYGFSVTLAPANLFACFVGVFVGTLIGVLPGIGPLATLSMLLPITFYLEPITALIMLSVVLAAGLGETKLASSRAAALSQAGHQDVVMLCARPIQNGISEQD